MRKHICPTSDSQDTVRKLHCEEVTPVTFSVAAGNWYSKYTIHAVVLCVCNGTCVLSKCPVCVTEAVAWTSKLILFCCCSFCLHPWAYKTLKFMIEQLTIHIWHGHHYKNAGSDMQATKPVIVCSMHTKSNLTWCGLYICQQLAVVHPQSGNDNPGLSVNVSPVFVLRTTGQRKLTQLSLCTGCHLVNNLYPSVRSY